MLFKQIQTDFQELGIINNSVMKHAWWEINITCQVSEQPVLSIFWLSNTHNTLTINGWTRTFKEGASQVKNVFGKGHKYPATVFWQYTCDLRMIIHKRKRWQRNVSENKNRTNNETIGSYWIYKQCILVRHTQKMYQQKTTMEMWTKYK